MWFHIKSLSFPEAKSAALVMEEPEELTGIYESRTFGQSNKCDIFAVICFSHITTEKYDLIQKRLQIRILIITFLIV